MGVEQVEVEEGFGAIGASDGKDVVVNAKGGEGSEVVGVGSAESAGESAGTDDADN